MSARVFIVCGLSFAAFVFLSICYGIYRRVMRARKEFAKYRYEKKVVEAKDTADEVEQQIWGIG